MSLAVATSIPVAAWLDEDPRTVVTAIKILEEQEKAARKSDKRTPGAGGPNSPQYSG